MAARKAMALIDVVMRGFFPNELPSSAVLRKDQAHFTEPRGLARGLNTTNENQNLLHQAIRPSSR